MRGVAPKNKEAKLGTLSGALHQGHIDKHCPMGGAEPQDPTDRCFAFASLFLISKPSKLQWFFPKKHRNVNTLHTQKIRIEKQPPNTNQINSMHAKTQPTSVSSRTSILIIQSTKNS